MGCTISRAAWPHDRVQFFECPAELHDPIASLSSEITIHIAIEHGSAARAHFVTACPDSAKSGKVPVNVACCFEAGWVLIVIDCW